MCESQPDQAPLTWSEPVGRIGKDGLERERAATEQECAAVARALGIEACKALTATYSVSHLPKGRFSVQGAAKATVVQTCVVTLDPVELEVVEEISVEFWPPDQLEASSSAPGREVDVEALAGEDPEPILHGQLPIGAIVYQLLAAGLDPFPRSADAALERTEARASEDEADATNPFAALRSLKGKTEGPAGSGD